MHVCTQDACAHTQIRGGRGACAMGMCFLEPLEVSSQAPSRLNKRPSVGSHWAAFSGPFRSLLQVQFAAGPALMGCRLCPWTITLSQLSIYATGKAFSLSKSKAGQPSAGWPGALTAHEFQGSSQPRLTLHPGPQAFLGVGWDGTEDEKIKCCRIPTSHQLVAKRKLMELGSFGPQGESFLLSLEAPSSIQGPLSREGSLLGAGVLVLFL